MTMETEKFIAVIRNAPEAFENLPEDIRRQLVEKPAETLAKLAPSPSLLKWTGTGFVAKAPGEI